MTFELLAYWEKREREARFLGPPWGPTTQVSAQSEKPTSQPVNESELLVSSNGILSTG